MSSDAISDLCHMEMYEVVTAANDQEMRCIPTILLYCYQKCVIKMARCHGDSTIETGKIIITY